MKALKLIIIISLLFTSTTISAEDEIINFNTHSHMGFTCAMNISKELKQYAGGSVFTVDPVKFAHYFSVKAGLVMESNQEIYKNSINYASTKKINSWLAGYLGGGLMRSVNAEERSVYHSLQVVGGLLAVIDNNIYLEVGIEGYNKSISFGIGFSGLITKVKGCDK